MFEDKEKFIDETRFHLEHALYRLLSRKGTNVKNEQGNDYLFATVSALTSVLHEQTAMLLSITEADKRTIVLSIVRSQLDKCMDPELIFDRTNAIIQEGKAVNN